jgi:hypothetical protein
MFSRNFRLDTVAVAAALALGLAACDAEPEDETGTVPATGEVIDDALDIEEVHLGRAVGADMRIAEEVTDFTAGDSVYVSVRLEGTANAATVTARWTTEGDSLVHEETKTVSSAGEQWAWFSLGTQSLPDGDYELKLLVDGDEDEEREFHIGSRDG